MKPYGLTTPLILMGIKKTKSGNELWLHPKINLSEICAQQYLLVSAVFKVLLELILFEIM